MGRGMRALLTVTTLAVLTVGVSGPAAASQAAGRGTNGPSAPASLAGTWRAAPDDVKLTSAFDASVWGAGATKQRLVEMVGQASGTAILTVTRQVRNAKGAVVAGSVTTERAELRVGPIATPNGDRPEYQVEVVKAERRYGGTDTETWPLDGLKVRLVAIDATTIDVRFDTPEGTGSFWETLKKASAAKRPAR